MRISDWSSDVCSSDLTDLSPSGSNPSYLGEYHAPAGACRASQATEGRSSCLASSSIACERWPRPCRRMIAAFACSTGGPVTIVPLGPSWETVIAALQQYGGIAGDRKTVVSGKSVSVSVDLGGRRIIKKKNIINTTM